MPEQSIILTGAAGGVGMAATRQMVAAGYVVYAGAIDDWEESELEGLKSELNTDRIIPVRLDLRKRDDIEAVVARVEQENPHLAAVVTNGASCPMGVPFEYLEEDFVREVYEVNVFGNFALYQRCLDLLKQSKGRIVHVSSLFGKTAGAFQLAYSSSKHSGEAILMILRRELEQYGIKVVITNPGRIWDTYMLAAQHEGSKNIIAEMKNCTPEEVSPNTYNAGKNTEITQPKLVADKKYLPHYKGMLDACASGLVPSKTGSSPDDIADAIMKGIELPNPKVRYINGIDSWLIIQFTRFLPEKFMDYLLGKMMVRE